MKLYVIVEKGYEWTDILGIYDNFEKAKRIADINKNDYSIEVYDLNELSENGVSAITGYIQKLKRDLGVE